MADLKISALTASTTPLAGTEVLPIVQSSTTKQVSVANLTAGRAVSSKNLTATDLTAGQVPFVGTAGLIQSGTALVFDGRNFGLNTTLAGADTRFTNFEFGNCSSLSSIFVGSTTLLTYFQHNSYVDATGTTKFKSAGSNYAMQYNMGGSTHTWQTSNAAGTAGNTVTYNTLMTLDSAGNNTLATGNLVIGTSGKGISLPGGITWTSGAGSPEGVVTAPVGSLYSRSDGGLLTSFYVKESGSGNTGWVGK